MVDRRLHGPDGLTAVPHRLRAPPGFHPDAGHLRINLAMAILPDTAARAVPEPLGAVHRARHAGRGENALPAHAAVEQSALGRALNGCNRLLETVEPNPAQQWRRRDQHALENGVDALQEPGVPYAPDAQREGARVPGL